MENAMQAPEWLRREVAALESSSALDKLVDAARPVGAAMADGSRGRVLRGEWLGHALHPLMTDLPLGCWLASGLLDLVGGKSSRRASRKLVGLGLVFVPGTVASGWADWDSTTDHRVKRVGVVHAVGNGVVALLYFLSWRARRHDRHLRGKALGLLGGTLAWGTGYLGGHMSFARGSSVEPRGIDDDGAGMPAVGPLDELIGIEEAARLAEVPVDQVRTMVDEGMLTPVGNGEMRFRRAEVLAVRLVGG